MGKYGVAKWFMSSVPGSREMLARAYMRLPRTLSRAAYRIARTTIFRDNEKRLPVFEAAFAEVAKSKRPGDYLEFGVARGTSLISAFDIARNNHTFDQMRFFAFDSFRGLPSGEGDFVAGDMAYAQNTFMSFIERAGVDLERVRTTQGFFDKTLTAELAAVLRIAHGRAHIVHIDCDLYQSTVPVLDFIAPLLGAGSVIIFDDWFSFDQEPNPAEYGEQRAFAEWIERSKFDLLSLTPGWNVAWKRLDN